MNKFRWILLMTKRAILSLLTCFLIAMVFLGSNDAGASGLATPSSSSSDTNVPGATQLPNNHVYFSRTVHNNDCSPSDNIGPDSQNIGDDCIAKRQPGEPSDPQFPKWWISDWTMYRVFQKYNEFSPPYASPPEGLTPSDYEVSRGTTYYDSTYRPPNWWDWQRGTGAMMEYYEKRCLPIFPRPNDYTCAFVSLGNKAYFLNYQGKQPNENPDVCLFSPNNHPPRTDFIKHLPYNVQESKHVGDSLQAYSILVGPEKILFGYAFYKEPTLNGFDQTAIPYRHPQSFYFSGVPTDPPLAPIVSQNYINFRMEKPNPEIWSKVDSLVKRTPNIKKCCLFPDDCHSKTPSGTLQPGS